MNCHQVTQSASDFLDRRLGWRRRIAFLLHIALCRACRAFVEQMRLTLLGIRSLSPPDATSPGRADLVERYREEFRGRGRK